MKRLAAFRRTLSVKLPTLRRLLRPVAWTVLVLLVAGVVLIGCLALFTGMCNIRAVNITGFRYLTGQYLEGLSGVDNYQNLITLPVGRIKKNLESNSWIADAYISRRLLHTVDIQVVERTPLAVLETPGGDMVVQGDGYVIGQAAKGQFPNLPRIYWGETPGPTVGTTVREKAVLECIKVVDAMPQALRDTLALGNPFDGRGPVFISRLGFNVVYGQPKETGQKNDILQAILVDVANNKRSIAYVDVRVPDAPVIKPL